MADQGERAKDDELNFGDHRLSVGAQKLDRRMAAGALCVFLKWLDGGCSIHGFSAG